MKRHKLYLFGHIIDVILTADDKEYGGYSTNRGTIGLFDGLSDSLRASTLLHEVMEAGIEIQVGDQWKQHPDDEKLEFMIRLTENTFFTLARDKRNRWLFELLLGDLTWDG